jgi:hypothetical protein
MIVAIHAKHGSVHEIIRENIHDGYSEYLCATICKEGYAWDTKAYSEDYEIFKSDDLRIPSSDEIKKIQKYTTHKILPLMKTNVPFSYIENDSDLIIKDIILKSLKEYYQQIFDKEREIEDLQYRQECNHGKSIIDEANKASPIDQGGKGFAFALLALSESFDSPMKEDEFNTKVSELKKYRYCLKAIIDDYEKNKFSLIKLKK